MVKSKVFTLITVLTYGFLYLPILTLAVFSFNGVRSTAVWQGFTLEWYERLLSDPMILEAVQNSAVVATLSALVSTAAGSLAAPVVARNAGRLRSVLVTLTLYPLIIPDIVIGIAMLVLLVMLHVPLGLGTIVVGHSVFNIAYVVCIVASRLASYDSKLELAAHDLGADKKTVFWTIKLPLICPSIIAAAILAFTLSFDEFIIAFLTSGVGATTLPIRIYSMSRFGVSPEINALSTVVLLFTSFSILVVQLLLNRSASIDLDVGALAVKAK